MVVTLFFLTYHIRYSILKWIYEISNKEELNWGTIVCLITNIFDVNSFLDDAMDHQISNNFWHLYSMIIHKIGRNWTFESTAEYFNVYIQEGSRDVSWKFSIWVSKG